MQEKLMEYSSAKHGWPLSPNILDPVRASTVCRPVTDPPGPGLVRWAQAATLRRLLGGAGKEQVCFPSERAGGGYRDSTVYVVYEGSHGLKIIGEIQIQDRKLYNLKLKVCCLS